jgi:hypothetical protein
MLKNKERPKNVYGRIPSLRATSPLELEVVAEQVNQIVES